MNYYNILLGFCRIRMVCRNWKLKTTFSRFTCSYNFKCALGSASQMPSSQKDMKYLCAGMDCGPRLRASLVVPFCGMVMHVFLELHEPNQDPAIKSPLLFVSPIWASLIAKTSE